MEEKEVSIRREVLERTTLIEQVNQLVEDVNELITRKLDFQGFVVLSIGIELLGSLYDAFDINDFNHSETRFGNGLKDFKNRWYKNNTTWLYKNLRGPLVHQYRPGAEIKLTSKCKHNVPLNKHLTLNEDKRLFVLEQLLDDFAGAVKNVNHQVAKQKLSTHKKAGLPHQEVVIHENTPASGTTVSDVIILKNIKNN